MDNQITKSFWQSKTVWLGILTCLVGVVAFIQGQYPDIAVLVTVKGVLDIIMRTLVTTPIA